MFAHGQSAGDYDGVFWNGLTNAGKFVFIVGMAHGEMATFQVLHNLDEKPIIEVLFEKLNDDRIVNKMIEDIDKFYKDNPKDIARPVYVVYLFTLEASKID
jgi:hypothetical protein